MRSNQKITWILVASRADACVYESRGRAAPAAQVAQFDNPRGRLKPGELDTDRPGRAFDRYGHGRHAMAVAESPDDHVERVFAAELVDYLERGRRASAFDRLVLIAPPKLLGKLRDGLPDPLAAIVVAALAKDLSRTGAEDVRQHIDDLALV